MDYGLLEFMSNGVIIGNFKSLEIDYMNKVAKKLLEIPLEEEKMDISCLFRTEDDFLSFQNEMCSKIGAVDKFSGIMYIKNNAGMNMKIAYQGKIVDKEEMKIAYVFENIEEAFENDGISYKNLFEKLPSAMLIISVQSEFIITYGSDEYYNILGYKENERSEHIQNNLRRMVYEEDREWVMAEIYNYIHCDEDVDVEFRMKTKDSVKWVRLWGSLRTNDDNTKSIYAILKDISSRREPNDKDHMEKILLHKVTELSNEILFRVDLKAKVIYFLGGDIESLALEPIIENFPESFLITQKIYSEDITAFEELIMNFQKGISEPKDIRFITPDGTVKWFQIIYNFVTNTAKAPLLVIGKIVDIQEQKQLEERARLDVLTKCYNKATTASEIQNIISDYGTDTKHVFFIIDVDNFKPINDNLGHHFGDLVLQEVADTLKQSFRKQDVVGRIGGDEFVVFMANCDNDDIILEKANKLSEVMRKTYKGENDSYSISGSIGIALFPTHGYSYEELYKAADKALYESKKQGKDCYTLYYTEITDDNRTTTEMNNGGRTRNQLLDVNVISTVFNLLYETKDLGVSIKSVIQYLGIHFDVDRCYIFDAFDNIDAFSNSYEWTRRLSISEKKVIRTISKEDFKAIFDNANEEGIFKVNSSEDEHYAKVQEVFGVDKVKSVLLVESLKEAEERIFFGVEDCTDERHWSDREIRTLFQVSRIIFAFLINYNKELILNQKVETVIKKYVK